MSHNGHHAVIVGAGQAGFSAASTLRSAGFTGRVTLIGNEDLPPYQRPPLSKSFLLEETTEQQLLLRPQAFFAQDRLELRLQTQVDAIEMGAARLRLSGGETIAFDLLCLATGASPRPWSLTAGGGLENVFLLRNIEQVRRLAKRMASSRNAVIIGGGYLGLELAASFTQRGLFVAVIEAGERILHRVASADTAALIRGVHEANGVRVHERCEVRELRGRSQVESVVLSDGTILPADLVVVAIGVLPNISLAQQAGLDIENGICVDSFMRTSAEGVWAAGDCAAFLYRGRRRRIESVGNAIDTAESAAHAMLGEVRPHVTLPWFWSDQYDLRLQIAGLCDGYDRVVARLTEKGVSHWYYSGDDLLAVDAINDSRAYMVGRKLIEMGRSPDPTDVQDTSRDPKSLLR